MGTPRRARGTPGRPPSTRTERARCRAPLASRIARWRTGEPAGADDADARARAARPSSGGKTRPRSPRRPPTPRATATDAHARVNAVVEARTRRLAREGTTAKARVAVRVAESNASRSAERGVRGERARAPLHEQPDLREALTLISPRAGRTRRRRVPASRGGDLYENYARSARASAEMGGETGDARRRGSRRRVTRRARPRDSGAAYGKTHDPLEMTRELRLPSPAAGGAASWDASPAKGTTPSRAARRRPSLVGASPGASSAPRPPDARRRPPRPPPVSSTGRSRPGTEPETAPEPEPEAAPEPSRSPSRSQSRSPSRSQSRSQSRSLLSPKKKTRIQRRRIPRRTNPRRAPGRSGRGAALSATNLAAARGIGERGVAETDAGPAAGPVGRAARPRRARAPPGISPALASPEPAFSDARSCRSSRSTSRAPPAPALRAQPPGEDGGARGEGFGARRGAGRGRRRPDRRRGGCRGG